MRAGTTTAGGTATVTASVAVVAPEPALRDQVERALEAAAMSVAFSAGDAGDLVSLCRLERPDAAVVATDAGPLRRGTELALLATELPGLPAIVVIGEDSRGAVVKALRQGAAGVVLDTTIEAALAPAVRTALAAQICLPRAPATSPPRERVSRREAEVFEMLARGLTNQQIALQLSLSESTVKTHVSNILRKLGVASRAEAAALALAS